MMRLLSPLFWICMSVALPLAPATRAAPPQSEPTAPSPPAAQAQSAADDLPILAAQDLRLQYYTTKSFSAERLVDLIQGMLTRRFYVRAADGTLGEPVSNVRTYGKTVLIYDLPDRIAEITRVLSEMEPALLGPAEPAEPLQVAEFTPRNTSLKSAAERLRPFERTVRGNGFEAIDNISTVESPATLVLHDTPENIAQMLAVLERLDATPPQLVFTCWLLRGTEAESTPGLPPELIDNLRRLLPFAGFERVSMGMLRSTIVTGQQVALSAHYQVGDQDGRYELKLEPSGYDRATGVLSLARCQFQNSSQQQFETGVVLKVGEYVVLGGSGSDPLFVVLRFTPVDG